MKMPQRGRKHSIHSSGMVLEDHGHRRKCLLCARHFTGNFNRSPVLRVTSISAAFSSLKENASQKQQQLGKEAAFSSWIEGTAPHGRDAVR